MHWYFEGTEWRLLQLFWYPVRRRVCQTSLAISIVSGRILYCSFTWLYSRYPVDIVWQDKVRPVHYKVLHQHPQWQHKVKGSQDVQEDIAKPVIHVRSYSACSLTKWVIRHRAPAGKKEQVVHLGCSGTPMAIDFIGTYASSILSSGTAKVVRRKMFKRMDRKMSR